MGMSAEQFYQVVLLPQGQFARFLHADAEERRALLQKLFRTDRFRSVEDWLADLRKTTRDRIKDAEQDLSVLTARIEQVAAVPRPQPARHSRRTRPPLADTTPPHSRPARHHSPHAPLPPPRADSRQHHSRPVQTRKPTSESSAPADPPAATERPATWAARPRRRGRRRSRPRRRGGPRGPVRPGRGPRARRTAYASRPAASAAAPPSSPAATNCAPPAPSGPHCAANSPPPSAPPPLLNILLMRVDPGRPWPRAATWRTGRASRPLRPVWPPRPAPRITRSRRPNDASTPASCKPCATWPSRPRPKTPWPSRPTGAPPPVAGTSTKPAGSWPGSGPSLTSDPASTPPPSRPLLASRSPGPRRNGCARPRLTPPSWPTTAPASVTCASRRPPLAITPPTSANGPSSYGRSGSTA